MKRYLLPVLFLAMALTAVCRAEITTLQPGDVLSVNVSKAFVFAEQDKIRFDCAAALEADTPPERVTLKIDYENDAQIDDSVTFVSPEGAQVAYAFYHVYPTPGYWTAAVYANIDGDEYDLEAPTVSAAKWRFTNNGTMGGVSGAPAIDPDGVIYITSEDGACYAVNPDGTLNWSFATGGPIKGGPVLGPDGAVYAGSTDGYIYARNPDNTEKWPPFLTGGPVLAAPALSRDGQTLYAASTDGRLYAISAQTGASIWPNDFITANKLIASPVVGHDGTIYIGGLDHYFYAVNPDGSLAWKIDLKSEIHGPAALDGDGMIYVGTCLFGGAKNAANRLIALYPHGKEKWSVDIDSGFASAPVVDASGMICAGSYDNKVYAFDRNGEKLWVFSKFTDDLMGSPAIAGTGRSELGTLVYAAGRDGMVYALNPEEFDYFSGREIIWQYRLQAPVLATSPAIFNGMVYVGAGDELAGELWALAAEKLDIDKTSQASAKADAPWPLARQNVRNTGLTAATPDTIAPAVIQTDPANRALDLKVSRESITATLSLPVDPDLIYSPATETTEAFIGFTVKPLYRLETVETTDPETGETISTETLLDADPEDFEIRWVNDREVKLILPEKVAFQKDTLYTATLQTKTATNANDHRKRLLSPHVWTFMADSTVAPHYSGDRGCFIGTLQDF